MGQVKSSTAQCKSMGKVKGGKSLFLSFIRVQTNPYGTVHENLPEVVPSFASFRHKSHAAHFFPGVLLRVVGCVAEFVVELSFSKRESLMPNGAGLRKWMPRLMGCLASRPAAAFLLLRRRPLPSSFRYSTMRASWMHSAASSFILADSSLTSQSQRRGQFYDRKLLAPLLQGLKLVHDALDEPISADDLLFVVVDENYEKPLFAGAEILSIDWSQGGRELIPRDLGRAR